MVHNNNIVFGDKFTHDERLSESALSHDAVSNSFPSTIQVAHAVHGYINVLKLEHKMHINALSHSLEKIIVHSMSKNIVLISSIQFT